MQIRLADTVDLPPMAEMAVTQQAVASTFIAYLGDTVESIATDVAAIDHWPERTAVATDGGRVVGWLAGEEDDEMGRVWWWGPFVSDRPDRAAVADKLYRLAASAVTADEEELAPDDRNRWVAECALRWGFHPETASAVLRYTGSGFDDVAGVSDLGPEHASATAALHDLLFPGTHTPGAMLVSADHPRLVLAMDGRVAGYVAVETQSDGSGYVDYLGVDPELRNRGIGRDLVRAATNRLLQLGATSVNLTVREDNVAARRLYAALGFEEERLIRPFRKGFSLG